MKTKFPNLFLFTGKNTYTLQEEVRRWKHTFLEKHGEANLTLHDGALLEWRRFCDEARTAPFLSDKRLLILDSLPAITKEEWELLLPEMHEQTLLLIIEPSLDKRKSIVKFLFQVAIVHTFSPLTQEKLTAWLLSLCHTRGVTLHPDDAAYLIHLVGNDQWHLKEECLKVISFAAPHPPTRMDMEKVCLPNGTHAEWTLSDLIGKGMVEEAASYSRALFSSGEDASYLWNAVFLTIVKNLVTLWMWQKEKNLAPMALARESGVHFLSVQSLLPLVRALDESRIRGIVRSVLSADYALKTGAIRVTAGHPIELQTMLERQILGLGK